MAMTDEEVREAWMTKAAVALCDLLEATREMELECGALYHAAHGLILYRERLFGVPSPGMYHAGEETAPGLPPAAPAAEASTSPTKAASETAQSPVIDDEQRPR
jgi:hypothetical protein